MILAEISICCSRWSGGSCSTLAACLGDSWIWFSATLSMPTFLSTTVDQCQSHNRADQPRQPPTGAAANIGEGLAGRDEGVDDTLGLRERGRHLAGDGSNGRRSAHRSPYVAFAMRSMSHVLGRQRGAIVTFILLANAYRVFIVLLPEKITRCTPLSTAFLP